MNTRKPRIALVLFIGLFFLTSSSFAQGFGNPEARAERAKAQIDEVMKKLNLDEEKSEQVRTILAEQSEQQGAIFEAYAGQQDRDSRSMMRQEMDDLRGMTNEKLKAILSADEMKVYNETVAEIRERMRGRFGGGRRGQASPNK